MNDSNVYKCSELTRKTRDVAPLPMRVANAPPPSPVAHHWAEHDIRDVLYITGWECAVQGLITISEKLTPTNLTAMAATLCRPLRG